MTTEPHLIFALRGLPYAVSALSVCEIIPLPALTPLAELPSYAAGAINMRGKVVPVIDLNLRMGHSRQTYRVTDSVILLEDHAALVGIIVNEVCRVRNIAQNEVEPPSSLSSAQDEEAAARFISGVAKVDGDLIMLLHLENLLHLQQDTAREALEEGHINSAPTIGPGFCPKATLEERAIFQARAQGIQQPLVNEDSSGLIPLAVVGLNGEHFAIDLALVREFSTLRSVTPVPCCPAHIVGQMNLRGDILTLVDIRSALQMPLASTQDKSNGVSEYDSVTGKVVVIESSALQVGVLVDEVFDVVNLHPTDICAIPAAVQPLSAEFLQGTSPYEKAMLSILNLPRILTAGALIVNEEV